MLGTGAPPHTVRYHQHAPQDTPRSLSPHVSLQDPAHSWTLHTTGQAVIPSSSQEAVIPSTSREAVIPSQLCGPGRRKSANSARQTAKFFQHEKGH